MGDEDDFVMEDDDFAYEEEGPGEDVDLENSYYNAKAIKEDDPRLALEQFQSVIGRYFNREYQWRLDHWALALNLVLAKKWQYSPLDNFLWAKEGTLDFFFTGPPSLANLQAPLENTLEWRCVVIFVGFFPLGGGPRGRHQGRVGLQGAQADDQDPLPAGQSEWNDEKVPGTADVHEERRDAELLGKVHQRHPRLHVHVQQHGPAAGFLPDHSGFLKGAFFKGELTIWYFPTNKGLTSFSASFAEAKQWHRSFSSRLNPWLFNWSIDWLFDLYCVSYRWTFRLIGWLVDWLANTSRNIFHFSNSFNADRPSKTSIHSMNSCLNWLEIFLRNMIKLFSEYFWNMLNTDIFLLIDWLIIRIFDWLIDWLIDRLIIRIFDWLIDWLAADKSTCSFFMAVQIFVCSLEVSKNERLWHKTLMKLGKLYFERGEYQKCQKIIKQLRTYLFCHVSPVNKYSLPLPLLIFLC